MDSVPAQPRDALEVVARIAQGGRTAVALSGGVDSATVAHLAHRALGVEAVAVTLTGPSIAAEELDRARRVAGAIGIEHVELPANQLDVIEYRANPSNRCYFCRRSEMTALLAWGSGRRIAQVLDGLHLDDLGEERPGLRALDEAGVVHPLLWAAWRKSDVRSYARAAGLPNWDQPSEACLASRVARGSPISPELLGRIERAEAQLHTLGFRRVRVRTDGVDARVVVDRAELARLLQEPLASEIRRAVASTGFRTVTVDPVGYPDRPGA